MSIHYAAPVWNRTDYGLAGADNAASLGDENRYDRCLIAESERPDLGECDWWRAAVDCPPGRGSNCIRGMFAFTEFPRIPRGERNRRDTKKIQILGGNVLLFSTDGLLSG